VGRQQDLTRLGVGVSEAYRYQSPAATTPYDRVATCVEAATIEGLELLHKGSVAADHAIRPVEVLPADVDASVSLELKIARAAAAVAATEAKLAGAPSTQSKMRTPALLDCMRIGRA